jgi:hypothetical protein
MKYLFLTAFVCYFCSTSVVGAQDFGAGIVLGTTYNRSYVEPKSTAAGYDPAMGLVFGGGGSYQWHPNFGLRFDILFQPMGYKASNTTFRQNYIALSLLPRIIFRKSLMAEGGIIGGIALNESLPNRTPTHLMWQAGLAVPINRFELSARYFQSFAPFYTESTSLIDRKFFNRGVQFAVNYRILWISRR